MTNRSIPVTATGDVAAGVDGGFLFSGCLAAGAGAAATAVVKSGGSSGTVILTLAAGQGTTASHTFQGAVPYVTPLHVTISGAGASLNLEM